MGGAARAPENRKARGGHEEHQHTKRKKGGQAVAGQRPIDSKNAVEQHETDRAENIATWLPSFLRENPARREQREKKERTSVHSLTLSCLHADRLPCGHAAVLRSSRLPAGAFPLGATLSHWNLEDGPSRAYLFSHCAYTDNKGNNRTRKGQMGGEKRTTAGQEHGKNKPQQEDRRTRSGDSLAAADNLVTTRGQQEEKKRSRTGPPKKKGKNCTTGGQGLETSWQLHTRKRTRWTRRGQQQDDAWTQRLPARPETVASFSFAQTELQQ